VGMDMSRKFIQMGMTRAKRYANHEGGRKYEKVEGGGRGELIEKSRGHEGKEEKEEVSRVFKVGWERCKEHEGYVALKERFLREQKEWEEGKASVKGGDPVAETGLQNRRSLRLRKKNRDD